MDIKNSKTLTWIKIWWRMISINLYALISYKNKYLVFVGIKENTLSVIIFITSVQYMWDRDRSICSSTKCALKIYQQTIILLKLSNGMVYNEHFHQLPIMGYFCVKAIPTLSFILLRSDYLSVCYEY